MGERRRRFGNVRELPSNKWQARYTAPDGLPRKAPHLFATRRSAERWLVSVEAELLRGDWLDPDAGRITLNEYATEWVQHRDLKARTREEYQRHLRLHVRSSLGTRELNKLAPPHIRAWRAELLDAGVGKPTVAKTYRILHAIMATAVDDDLIRRNPCRIKSAGQEQSEERPTATLGQVFAIADAVPERYHLLVLLATFAQLRFGELVALRRRDIDRHAMELRVARATAEMEDGSQVDDEPKSRAGKRPISLPRALSADIELHLARYAAPGRDGRLFVGPRGGIPRRRNFNRVWKAALVKAKIPADLGLHLHDLRHTGSTWSVTRRVASDATAGGFRRTG